MKEYKRFTTHKISLDKLSDRAKERISDTYLIYAQTNNVLYNLEDQIENGILVNIEQVGELLYRIFGDCPCNYEIDDQHLDEFIFDNFDEYCSGCTDDYKTCWTMYAKAKLKELQNEMS